MRSTSSLGMPQWCSILTNISMTRLTLHVQSQHQSHVQCCMVAVAVYEVHVLFGHAAVVQHPHKHLYDQTHPAPTTSVSKPRLVLQYCHAPPSAPVVLSCISSTGVTVRATRRMSGQAMKERNSRADLRLSCVGICCQLYLQVTQQYTSPTSLHKPYKPTQALQAYTALQKQRGQDSWWVLWLAGLELQACVQVRGAAEAQGL